MYKVKTLDKAIRRKSRIRPKVTGTKEVPRLTVFRSNRYIYAQLINDDKGQEIASTSAFSKELHVGVSKVEASLKVGEKIAELGKAKKVKKVRFDRNGYIYHGRVKSVAEGARKGGLEL